jgi:hypothetical protein
MHAWAAGPHPTLTSFGADVFGPAGKLLPARVAASCAVISADAEGDRGVGSSGCGGAGAAAAGVIEGSGEPGVA